MTYQIYFDGACWNRPDDENPIMGIGVAVFANGQYVPDFSFAQNYQHSTIRGTNNIAEWRGAVLALELASQLKDYITEDEKILIYSDSQIISEQYNGRYQIKNEDFTEFYEKAKKYGKLAGIEEINWIPREQNRYADCLSKIGRKHLQVNEMVGEIEIEERKMGKKTQLFPYSIDYSNPFNSIHYTEAITTL